MMVEPKQKTTKSEIPSLKDFIYAPDEMKKHVKNLEIYYQFCHQSSIKLYEKWDGKLDKFQGNFYDYIELVDFDDMLKFVLDKDWYFLITAISLIKHNTHDVNLKGFHKLKTEWQQQVFKIITNGQLAFDELNKWLEPINKKETLQAIYDAVKVTMGNDRYDDFQVLKFGDIESNQSEGVQLHKQILEIDNPSALIEYFKLQPKKINDSLIITFMRNKKYDFKPILYIILILENKLYVADFGERRLNLDNTAGQRNPTRFYEKFDRVWLPLDVIFSDKKSKSKEIKLRNQTVFERGNLFLMFEKNPEFKVWLDMFTYRIIDYVKNPATKLKLGVTSHSVIRMLEDKSEKALDKRIKIKFLDKHDVSFESSDDAGSYLIKKYKSKVTSIVPSTDKFPMILGTQEFMEGVIKYRQRDNIAIIIQRLNYLDWKKNHNSVYKWFKKFVLEKDKIKLIRKALQDKEYSYMVFNTDAFAKKVKPHLGKKQIITYERHRWWYHDDQLQIVLHKSGLLYMNGKNVNCIVCNKFQYSIDLTVQFDDYREILEFFEIEKSELLPEFINHLHQQNETYVGNSILDDTDPIDELTDFWFRKVYDKETFVVGKTMFKNTNQQWAEGEAYIHILIPLCKRCHKKLQKENAQHSGIKVTKI